MPSNGGELAGQLLARYPLISAQVSADDIRTAITSAPYGAPSPSSVPRNPATAEHAPSWMMQAGQAEKQPAQVRGPRGAVLCGC